VAQKCNAKIRPMMDDTEISCELTTPGHVQHTGKLLDRAYKGSVTEISWLDHDRRNYRGEWPGHCYDPHCVLPSGHKGIHAH
jgi:hypothetical protein